MPNEWPNVETEVVRLVRNGLAALRFQVVPGKIAPPQLDPLPAVHP